MTDWMMLALGQRNFAAFQRYPSLSYSRDNSQGSATPTTATMPVDILTAISKADNDGKESDDYTSSGNVYSAALELGKIIAILEGDNETACLESKIKA